jgi:hypothetical protein
LFTDLIGSRSRLRARAKSEDSSKFIIATLYSEGSPHDGGDDLIAVEQYFRETVEHHADKYLSFNPRMLRSMDPVFDPCLKDYSDWLEQHPDRDQLGKYNPVWPRMGFQMWKPVLIRHLLNSAEVGMGDIVLWHDVNFRKYPAYILGCEQWRDLSFDILDELRCDIFMSRGLPLKNDVKAWLIRKVLGEDSFEESGLWNGLVVLRKSEMALQFVDEWVALSLQLDNISPLPNPDPHPEFVWHSVDQSVVGVLACRWRSDRRLPADWPRYQLRDRLFAAEALVGPKGKSATSLFEIWRKRPRAGRP